MILVCGGITTTIAQTELTGVTSVTTDGAVGTLKTTLNGAETSVVVKSDIGQTFDTFTPLKLELYNDDGVSVRRIDDILSTDMNSVMSVTRPDAIGTLKTALTGSGMTSVIIQAETGVVFESGTDHWNYHLKIGNTPSTTSTVLASKVTGLTSISKAKTISYLLTTFAVNNAYILEEQNVAVTQANGIIVWTFVTNNLAINLEQGVLVRNGHVTWTLTINVAGITAIRGTHVTQTSNSATGRIVTSLQNEYILTITSTTFTGAVQGATVTQVGGATGTLKTTLQGAVVFIYIYCESGVVFDTSGILTIDDNGTPVEIASNAITNSHHSSTTTSLIITCDLGQVFDTTVSFEAVITEKTLKQD